MELPKNITQIGEVDRTCKIYVEDYVVSYMKQLNRAARDKDMAVALYGKRREENGIVYYFLYGACKLDFLQREVRHLSQAQRQEIERFRRKYFPELAFMGYRLLDGDMIEGLHICEQDICRYISGYAQFYEKNDAMLAYMLDVREDVKPEQVDQEKYEEVKRRQEERRVSSEQQARGAKVLENTARNARNAEASARALTGTRRVSASVNLQRMRLTAVGVFALLCLLGIATFREGELRDTENSDALGALPVSGSVNKDNLYENTNVKDTLVMEDKLDEVLLKENQSAENKTNVSEISDLPEAGAQTQLTQQSGQAQQPESTQQPGSAQQPESTQQSGQAQQPESAQQSGQAQQPGSAQQSGQAQQPESAQQSGQAQQSGSTQQSGQAQQSDSTQQSDQKKESETTKVSPVTSGAVAYVIQPGDTLIAISKRQYGSDIRVADICNLNKISDPDNIKEGQVIMLPR